MDRGIRVEIFSLHLRDKSLQRKVQNEIASLVNSAKYLGKN